MKTDIKLKKQFDIEEIKSYFPGQIIDGNITDKEFKEICKNFLHLNLNRKQIKERKKKVILIKD